MSLLSCRLTSPNCECGARISGFCSSLCTAQEWQAHFLHRGSTCTSDGVLVDQSVRVDGPDLHQTNQRYISAGMTWGSSPGLARVKAEMTVHTSRLRGPRTVQMLRTSSHGGVSQIQVVDPPGRVYAPKDKALPWKLVTIPLAMTCRYHIQSHTSQIGFLVHVAKASNWTVHTDWP